MKNLLLGWRNCLGKHSSDIWNLTPLCLMWLILRESNRSTFEDMESSGEQVLESFIGGLCLIFLGLGDSHLVTPS